MKLIIYGSFNCPYSQPDSLRAGRLAAAGATEVMDEWRCDWLSLGKPGVPTLVLPDGTVSRGLEVLRQLAGLIPAADR